jgi:hypothetical protein
VRLGVVLGEHEEGWASEMDKERIIVHGPLAVIGVEASDAATQLTVVHVVVDLDGGWDDGPEGRLAIVDDDDGKYAMELRGGAGDDWFDATKASAHVVLKGHGGDDVPLANGGDVGGDDWVYGGGGKDLLNGGPAPTTCTAATAAWTSATPIPAMSRSSAARRSSDSTPHAPSAVRRAASPRTCGGTHG